MIPESERDFCEVLALGDVYTRLSDQLFWWILNHKSSGFSHSTEIMNFCQNDHTTLAHLSRDISLNRNTPSLSYKTKKKSYLIQPCLANLSSSYSNSWQTQPPASERSIKYTKSIIRQILIQNHAQYPQSCVTTGNCIIFLTCELSLKIYQLLSTVTKIEFYTYIKTRLPWGMKIACIVSHFILLAT